jgi:CobQ-like glutamine amidotransferase family enzyme
VAEELAIVSVYPELLGTYGDRGNVLALVHRARARGIAVRAIEVDLDDPVPRDGDLYCLGGGEDHAQLLAARALAGHDRIAEVFASRPTLAVCAGLQLLSRSFNDGDGKTHTGLGLLDVRCERLESRAVGEVVTEPVGAAADAGVPTLTGFENHRGTAVVGPEAEPLARLVSGVGNGDALTEGAQQGTVVATYLHGPALVRNPALADLLLSRAAGPLPPYHDVEVDRLRAERLDAADPRRHRARRALLRR